MNSVLYICIIFLSFGLTSTAQTYQIGHTTLTFVDVSRNKLDFEETQKYWQENFYYFRPDDLYQKKRYIFDVLFQKFRKSYNVDNWYPNKLSSFIKKITISYTQ